MKLFYKVFVTSLGALFMGFLTCFIFFYFIDKIGKDGVEALPILIFIPLLGFVTYLYGKMAWMRFRGIPVIELTDHNLIIRDAIRRTVSIPYKSIIDIRPTDGRINIVYRNGDMRKTQPITFIFVYADSSDVYDLLNELVDRINLAK